VNYYEHHIGDYDADTAHLSWLEDMAYTRLMRLYYRKEAPIPAAVADACRLVRAATKEHRQAVESVLHEFFTLAVDGWHQKRCDADVVRYQAKAERNREVGKLGGRPRKVETQTKPPGLFVGSHIEPKQNPLQSPDTRHQEENPPALRVPPKASPRATKKCPADYVVPEAVKAWARENAPRLDVDEQAAAMRDHTFATARTDWDGTLRNWLRKAHASPASVRPFQTAKERDRLAAEVRVREMTGGLLDRAFPRGDVIEMEVAHAAQIGSR